jgi:hypothetical protein
MKGFSHDMETLGKHFRTLTKQAMGKHGFAQAELLSHWPEIAGERLAAMCEPERITWPKKQELQGGSLVLRTEPGRTLDVQYAVPGLQERINQFFGYQAVATIKVLQGHVMKQQPRPVQRPVEPDAATLAHLQQIADPDLRQSLTRLAGSLKRSPQHKL